MDDSLLILFFLVFFGAIYFAPTIVAHVNDSDSKSGIFWLNLLLGWSGIGWLISIIWAVTSKQGRRSRIVGSISTPPSVADEIRKLDKLKDDGLITAEQFENQKANLLLE